MKREEVIQPADAALYFSEEYPQMFTEAYIVEATIDIVVANNFFRLEAYKRIHGTKPTRYDVHAYKKKNDSWQFFVVGYCDRPTATEAFMQAMSFLWDAFREK